MTTPATPEERAARRAEVSRLAGAGMSHRAIAKEIGVSKETVGRDLAHLARTGARQKSGVARHEPAPPAPPRETPAPPVSHHDPIAQLAAANPQLAADLATLTSCGRPAPSAIANAVGFMARAYRNGWNAGLVPEHIEPRIDGYKIVPFRPSD